MSPAGRPPLSDSRKDERLVIRLTVNEKSLIDAGASASGKQTSEWVRGLLLSAAHDAVTKKPAAKKK